MEELDKQSRVIVVGIGRSGIDTVRFAELKQRLAGEGIVIVDAESQQRNGKDMLEAIVELQRMSLVEQERNTFFIDSVNGIESDAWLRNVPQVKREPAAWGKRVCNKFGGIPRRNGK